MEQVRAHSDRRLALLYRTGWRRLGRIFNNRGIDREGVARRLRPDKFLELLKLDEIKLFLVQVRSQVAPAAKTRKAINEKKQTAPYTSKTSATIPPPSFASAPACPIRKIADFKLACYSTKMWRYLFQYIYTVL